MKLLYRSLGFLFRVLDAITVGKVAFPPRRVYFLRTHAIGDVLLTTAAIRAVKRAWPQAHITMLVGEKSRYALEGNPHIDSIQSFQEEWWFGRKYGKILSMTWSLRRQQKDVLVMFHASHLIHLWGFLLKAPIRVGFDEKGSGFALTHRVLREGKDYNRYLGDVNLDLVRALDISTEDHGLDFVLRDNELSAARALLAFPEKSGRRFLIGIAPGGGHNAFEKISVKHWPAGHYADLMTALSGQHEIEFIMLGDHNDSQVDEIQRKVGGQVTVLNLRGRTSFRELAGVICHLDILITNDSSPLHLAVALNKPVVGLFGPTAHWALFPPRRDRVALQSPAECSPCYTYGRFPGCAQPACMAALSVEEVKKAVESLLDLLEHNGSSTDRCKLA